MPDVRHFHKRSLDIIHLKINRAQIDFPSWREVLEVLQGSILFEWKLRRGGSILRAPSSGDVLLPPAVSQFHSKKVDGWGKQNRTDDWKSHPGSRYEHCNISKQRVLKTLHYDTHHGIVLVLQSSFHPTFRNAAFTVFVCLLWERPHRNSCRHVSLTFGIINLAMSRSSFPSWICATSQV